MASRRKWTAEQLLPVTVVEPGANRPGWSVQRDGEWLGVIWREGRDLGRALWRFHCGERLRYGDAGTRQQAINALREGR